MNTPRCRSCRHCQQQGRQQTQRGVLGRKRYYCDHPDARARDPRMSGFVGFSDTKEFNQVLKLKTRPKWCPLLAERTADK